MSWLERLWEWWDIQRHGPVVLHHLEPDRGWRRQHRDGWTAPCRGPIPASAASRWFEKQRLAAPSRYYGDGGTVHQSTELAVETHHGTVVAVWFRCQPLPFLQHEVDAERATEMERLAFDHTSLPRLTGVEVLDPQFPGVPDDPPISTWTR